MWFHKQRKQEFTQQGAYVVIGGQRHPVKSVRLYAHAYVVVFQRRGPIRATRGPITLFGSDAEGIVQGKVWDLRELKAGEYWECEWCMRISAVDTADDYVFRPCP